MSDDFKDFEHEGWQQSVDEYDASFGGLTRQTMPALLEALQARHGSVVLDVACGPGYLSELAAKHGVWVQGIDFSPKMVALARERYPTFAFAIGDAEALPFNDSLFDGVALNFVVIHLGNPRQALVEAARVLKPGGKVAFTSWASPKEARGFGLVLEAIERLGNPHVPLPKAPPFFYFSDPNHCLELLGSSGFTQAEVKRLPLEWKLPTPESLFDAFYRGTARTGGLLRRQAAADLERISQAVTQSASELIRDGSVYLPMPAMLSWGVKP